MLFKITSDKNRKIQDSVKWDLIDIYTQRYKPGTAFELEITRRKTPNPGQRKFYFGHVLKPLLARVGYEPHESILVHHLLKTQYFKDNPKFNIHQDKRGIWRGVPSVFSNNPDITPGVRKAFIEYVIRIGVREGVEYEF